MNNHTHGEAEKITGQSGQELIVKHYHDRKVFDDAIKNFRIFKKENEPSI